MSSVKQLKPLGKPDGSTHGCIDSEACVYCRLKRDFGMDVVDAYNYILKHLGDAEIARLAREYGAAHLSDFSPAQQERDALRALIAAVEREGTNGVR
jgi:hypothetical protein